VTRRDDEKRVSYGEASLVREGMSLLREELAAALDITAEGAEDMVLTALRERVRPEIPEPALPNASCTSRPATPAPPRRRRIEAAITVRIARDGPGHDAGSRLRSRPSGPTPQRVAGRDCSRLRISPA